MPSKFTEHFNLNQWEKTDKVLMEDFNEDNLKIDAAFLNHRSAELICETVADSDGVTRLEVALSQVDWSRYAVVFLIAEITAKNHLEMRASNGSVRCIYLRPSTMSSGSDTVSDSTILAYAYGVKRFQSVFVPMYSGETYPMFLSTAAVNAYTGSPGPQSLSYGFSSLPLNQISSLYLYNRGDAFSIGDNVRLWGLK